MSPDHRPDMNEYLMGIAIAVRKRANCLGSRIGAVIALQGRIVVYTVLPSIAMPKRAADRIAFCSACTQMHRS